MTQSIKRTAGSVKNKIVNSDLEEERNKCDFDRVELELLLKGGEESMARINGLLSDMESDPILRHSEKYYEMSREE
jgi:hypothetical protein